MTTFQQTALFLTATWFMIVAVRFRRSIIVLLGGLVGIGGYVLAALAFGSAAPAELGLGIPDSWWQTIGFAIAWLALLLAYSPLADWLATQWIATPPSLQAFYALQQSRAKLIAGIVAALVLGGILEEIVVRGIVQKSVETMFSAWIIEPAATGLAVAAAALGAGLIHLYQGTRAAVIITQLSILFGVLYVISGYNLWAVMLCHGLYDTVAFIRFALKKSKYSDLRSAAQTSGVSLPGEG
jgi:uncharacterized protein